MGVRALITREYAEPLASMLDRRRVSSIHVPCIRLSPTGVAGPTEHRPDAVLITSAAVARFVPDLADVLGDAKVFAVGPRTASALNEVGVDVEYIGDEGGTEAMEKMLQTVASNHWHIGATQPSLRLKRALREHRVGTWAVYENTVPAGLQEALNRASYDAVVFTSGSAIRAYVAAIGVPKVPTVMIGPATCGVAKSLGIKAVSVAQTPTLESLADAVARVG